MIPEHLTGPQPEEPGNDWNIQAIATTLQTTPGPLPDAGAGPGFSFQLGEVSTFRPFRQVICELIPQARAVRVIAPGMYLELDDVRAPSVTLTAVVFRWEVAGCGAREVSLTRAGEVAVLLTPSTAESRPPGES